MAVIAFPPLVSVNPVSSKGRFGLEASSDEFGSGSPLAWVLIDRTSLSAR